jgi:2-isopropylmalate synthase
LSLRAVTGTGIAPQATVRIKHNKKILEVTSSGDGPVDACYKAIDTITGIKPKLTSYKLEAVTIGKDAQGFVRLEIALKHKHAHGSGTSTDILEASVKAYLDALNKL